MRVEKLGDIIKITSGGTPLTSKREYYENGDIPWVKTGDLKVRHLTEVPDSITRLGLENSSAKIFPPNTVLIAMYGATIGACSILKIEAATNQACAALLPNEKVNEEYLYFYLSSIKQGFINKGVGGGQPNISATILKETKFPLIPLSDQLHIANLLSKAENLISQRKQSIALLDEFLKSTFLEMFGDPIRNEKGWKSKIVSEIAEVLTGFAFKSNEYSDNKQDVKICGGLIIYPGSIDWEKAVCWSKEKTKGLEKYWLEEGDIIMALDRPWITSGFKMAIIKKSDPNALLIQRTARIRCKYMSYHYLYFLLSHKVFEKHCKPTETTVPHISPKEIQSFKVPIPPFELQTQFAQIVEKTESLKFQYQSSLQELENLYGSLSQRAFRGELTANLQTLNI
jgi:type I restriction enzyme S subunit